MKIWEMDTYRQGVYIKALCTTNNQLQYEIGNIEVAPYRISFLW